MKTLQLDHCNFCNSLDKFFTQFIGSFFDWEKKNSEKLKNSACGWQCNQAF